MLVIQGRNVNEVFFTAQVFARSEAGWEKRASRKNPAGDIVYEWPTPVTTQYNSPDECILYSAHRDANPFFHLFESLWILAGRNDVMFLAAVLPSMRNFSDNGATFYGAYGARIAPNIRDIIASLKADPDTRRAYLPIWVAGSDAASRETKDLPCNTGVSFRVRENWSRLDATVFCRSNDVIWGAYGANVVQFSFLLQYVAGWAGYEVGRLYQVSNSFHIYPKTRGLLVDDTSNGQDPYSSVHAANYYGGAVAVKPMPLIPPGVDPAAFDTDLNEFFYRFEYPQRGVKSYITPFFQNVVHPAWLGFRHYARARDGHLSPLERTKELYQSIEYLLQMPEDNDWRLAMIAWIQRRLAKTDGQPI
jgi:hypothetical protein